MRGEFFPASDLNGKNKEPLLGLEAFFAAFRFKGDDVDQTVYIFLGIHNVISY
jgi:hypothetical protein